MKLFLDTSVLLAACGSDRGASHFVCTTARTQRWELLASAYVFEEVLRNISQLPSVARARWPQLQERLRTVDDVLITDQPVVFPVTKDRPVLFTALAWADVLLTLDRADFSDILGHTFYGLVICSPGEFLEAERAAGRLVR